MASDNKKIAALIIGGMKPPPGKGKPEEEGESPDKQESEESPGDLETAASEVLDAIESRDPKALAETLKSFWKLCDYDEPQEGE